MLGRAQLIFLASQAGVLSCLSSTSLMILPMCTIKKDGTIR